MAPEGEFSGSRSATQERQPTFDLERFSWDAPDCLVVRGTFAGLGDTPSAAPTLVVRGADREVRLPAAAETVSTPPEDGQPWQARFVWEEPPIAFKAATLALGGDVAVELPELGANRGKFPRQTLPVRRNGPATAEAEVPAAASIERLRLEADLLAAQEQIREMAVAAERANEELNRTRADLEAERERSAADAQRFRENLARVSGAIEEAVSAERETAAQLRRELEEAQGLLAGKEAAIGELDRSREQTKAARDALAAAQKDAQRLVTRLTTIAEALGPPQ
jgi:hypothetical protein